MKLIQKCDDWGRRIKKLYQCLQLGLKEIYSQHLAGIMSDFLYYGCVCGKGSSLMHNLCNKPINYCIYFALNFVDEAAIMEPYGNEVGLAALEWLNIQMFQLDKCVWPMWFSTNGPPHDWLRAVVGWASSPCLSACGGRTDAHVDCPPSDWVRVVAGLRPPKG